jgi:hypothetical protein
MALWIRTQHLVAEGLLADAEKEARLAVQKSPPFPVFRAPVLATLAAILLRNGQAVEARQVAEEALQSVESCGGLGWHDVYVRLTTAEARRTTGDAKSADSALRMALLRIEQSSQAIPDPQMRHRFLTAVPENVRALQLANEWKIELA